MESLKVETFFETRCTTATTDYDSNHTVYEIFRYNVCVCSSWPAAYYVDWFFCPLLRFYTNSVNVLEMYLAWGHRTIIKDATPSNAIPTVRGNHLINQIPPVVISSVNCIAPVLL